MITLVLLKALARATEVFYGVLSRMSGCLNKNDLSQSFPAEPFAVLNGCGSLLTTAY